ncbi:MAG: 16S rRNA (cytosine(1402)-N(4))-methyltransferase RsmH [Clostridiaceae bacterium]|nr:16S rRNA (cytosine(1402)-N(4))-methyltransferase RsmH [Clostridiaceae bacterium]
MEFSHVPVLPQECIKGLDIKPDGIYVDGTTGGGGHSFLIALGLSDKGRLICIDRDNDALEAAGIRLAPLNKNITFVKSNFCDIKEVLKDLQIEKIDGILFDLGVSSFQLDNGDRGFSYMTDAPLDMRMDRDQSLSAYEVVNEYSREELKRIIKDYGEERFAGPIASAICRRREDKPIGTTLEFSDIIKSAMPAAAKREKQHPAKRTFQAIRIEVNGELAAVEQAVGDSVACLAQGGRIAVISFHSLEDRIVKKAFAFLAQGCTCPKEFPVCICGNKPKIKLISKGVITATEDELERNTRSRSAKLRIAEKL